MKFYKLLISSLNLISVRRDHYLYLMYLIPVFSKSVFGKNVFLKK